MLHKLCNKKLKYIKFLKRCIGVYRLTNVSPVTVWLFLELWDTIYIFTGDVGVRLLLPEDD